jgi:hypothetical protein
LKLVYKWISEFNSLAHLTDLLDYEYKTLSRFMNLGMPFWFKAILPIQSYKTNLEVLYQLALRLVNQKISEVNSHAQLTDLLDYEFKALDQFMNLGMSFWYRTTLPIQSHKTKLKALFQLVLRLVNRNISEFNSHAHLTDLLDYESETLGQFMNIGLPHAQS